MNYVMGKPWSGSVQQVLVEDKEHGTLTEHATQEPVQKAIFDNIHCNYFFLEEAASACNRPLRGLFGHNANMITAQCILNGTFTFPEDINQATKEICKECACIRLTIHKDSMNITITKDNWNWQWKGQRISTSSLESGLHFGHYIVGSNSDHIAYVHALKLTLVIKKGIVLDRWSCGLSVMLEKLFGCALITKLRSILLMEADFNSKHKIIYG